MFVSGIDGDFGTNAQGNRWQSIYAYIWVGEVAVFSKYDKVLFQCLS